MLLAGPSAAWTMARLGTDNTALILLLREARALLITSGIALEFLSLLPLDSLLSIY